MIRRATAGRRLRIRASDWNEVADSVNARNTGGGHPGAAAWNTGILTIKNDTGAALERGAIVKLSGALWTPSDSVNAFFTRPILKGTTATPTDTRLAVLLEPAGTGQLARAIVAGLAVAKITGATDSTKTAGPAASGNTLEADAGELPVIYAAAGEDYAVVHLGAGAGATGLQPATLLKVSGDAGAGTAYPTFTYKVTVAGQEVAAELTPEVPRLIMAKHIAATTGTAYQADGAWHLFQAFEQFAQGSCN